MRSRAAALEAIVVLLAVRLVFAHEPDGYAAIRYAWVEGTSSTARVLRLTVTPAIPLGEAELLAGFPDAAALTIRSLELAGNPSATALAGAWPEAGLRLGDIASGQAIEIELEVVEPPAGGILSIALEGGNGERRVREAIGVVLGHPGTEPVLRHGAAEFPAERGGRAP